MVPLNRRRVPPQSRWWGRLFSRQFSCQVHKLWKTFWSCCCPVLPPLNPQTGSWWGLLSYLLLRIPYLRPQPSTVRRHHADSAWRAGSTSHQGTDILGAASQDHRCCDITFQFSFGGSTALAVVWVPHQVLWVEVEFLKPFTEVAITAQEISCCISFT